MAFLIRDAKSFNPGTFRILLESVGVAVFVAGILSTILLVSGLVAWGRYGEDERQLLGKEGEVPSFSFKACWGWFETYLILAIFLAALGFWCFAHKLSDLPLP